MRCAKREPGRSWEAIDRELHKLGAIAMTRIRSMLHPESLHALGVGVFVSVMSRPAYPECLQCCIPCHCKYGELRS